MLQQRRIEDLSVLNARGFIPGPKESCEEFFERVERLQAVDLQNGVPLEDWHPAQKITEQLFGFSSDWILAEYSNKGLLPWEGAAVWAGTGGVTKVQLRENFQKGSYLGIYKRDEVLAHEAVHAARMAFEEPYFEEFFAYLTSASKWRKITGPFFHSPRETLFFISLLGISLLGTAFVSDFFALLPFLLLSFGFLRLFRKRRIFSRALKRCRQFIVNDPLPFLFRLTDEEIFLFASASKKKIDEYIKTETSIRWEIIRSVFIVR